MNRGDVGDVAAPVGMGRREKAAGLEPHRGCFLLFLPFDGEIFLFLPFAAGLGPHPLQMACVHRNSLLWFYIRGSKGKFWRWATGRWGTALCRSSHACAPSPPLAQPSWRVFTPTLRSWVGGGREGGGGRENY